jgi:hypothetical protein
LAFFVLNPKPIFLLFRPVPKAGFSPALSPGKFLDAFAKFLKTLGLVTLALCAGAALLAAFWPALHAGFGVAGVLLMAANALAAIGILRLRTGMEPVKLIMMSMLVRLGVLAAIMLSVIALVPHGPALYSFVFSAMAGYVVFQAVEVRHLSRNPELLAK